MHEQLTVAIAITFVLPLTVIWFSKTVTQGSITFSVKPLGIHFEVKKGRS